MYTIGQEICSLFFYITETEETHGGKNKGGHPIHSQIISELQKVTNIKCIILYRYTFLFNYGLLRKRRTTTTFTL
jgi:hypothetical protein